MCAWTHTIYSLFVTAHPTVFRAMGNNYNRASTSSTIQMTAVAHIGSDERVRKEGEWGRECVKTAMKTK